MSAEDLVASRYDAVATEYAELFGDVAVAHPLDRALFGVFADLVRGDGGSRVVDLGCGPGHWTDHLARLGLDPTGLDLSPAFVDLARRTHPDRVFEVGSMLASGLADASYDGAVAWWSLIHTPPDLVPAHLAEIARILVTGGRFLVGFGTTVDGSTEVEPVDHRVSPAYLWPVDALASAVTSAGFEVTVRNVREPEIGERRRQAALIARRDDG